MNGHQHGHDQAAVHGMLIVGGSKILLSHLPMFHSPHDYQILLEVTLREDGGDPTARYLDDRSTSGERIYTWVPEPFVLPSLLAPSSGVMQGTVFRGHFERGGTAITSNRVHADITRILYSRKFTSEREPSLNLQYILFGTPTESFLAHFITRPPDYDHILSAGVDAFPSGWDGTSLLLKFPDRQNSHEHRLHEGEQLNAAIVSASDTVLQIAVRREFYLETGDLTS